MSPHARRGDVQGLRAIAVLFVVAYHANLSLPGGFTGVDIFFAISGFVITGKLTRELEADGRLNIPGFYVGRIKRILPALAVMLVTVAVLGVLLAPVSAVPVGPHTGIFASLFAANGYLYRSGGGDYFAAYASLNPLLHTWTLAVEEQFYVAFPLLLAAGWAVAERFRRTRRPIVVSAAALVAVASIILAYRSPATFAFYSSPTRAWEFAAGALVALLATEIATIPTHVAYGLGVAGALAVAATGVLIDTTQSPATAALLPVAGTCLLMSAGTAISTGVSRLLATKPFQEIGNISYSWYLWHWPLIVFATALWPLSELAPPVAAALSLVPAALSYHYVENPIRINPRIQGRRAIALAVFCVGVPLAACAAWPAVFDRVIRQSPALASAKASELLAGDVYSCIGAFQPQSIVTASCTWKAAGSRGSVVLIGDSIAGTLGVPFKSAAASNHLDATLSTVPSCPFIDLRLRGGHQTVATCRRFYIDSMALLLAARPSLVVIANASIYVGSDIVPDTWQLGLPALTDWITRRSARGALWARGMASAIRQLNNAGIPVLIALPTPVTEVAPSACAVIRALAQSCPGSRSRGPVEAERHLIVAADLLAAQGASAASVVDFNGLICSPTDCPATRSGVALYHDQVHLSMVASAGLAARFARAIRAAAR